MHLLGDIVALIIVGIFARFALDASRRSGVLREREEAALVERDAAILAFFRRDLQSIHVDDVRLGENEVAYYRGSADLHYVERYTPRYSYGVLVQAAPGLFMPLNFSIADDPSFRSVFVDRGDAIVTNRRVLLRGDGGLHDIKFDRIEATQVFLSGIRLESPNRAQDLLLSDDWRLIATVERCRLGAFRAVNVNR